MPRKTAPQGLIGRTARLSFHPVLGAVTAQTPGALPDESGQPLALGPAALSGDGVEAAKATQDPQGAGWLVNVEFADGAATLLLRRR